MQRVIDYHNRKYGTGIVIVGICQEIYPELEGKLNWDWVCIDIKRVENYQLRERFSVLKQIFNELSNNLFAV